MGEVGSKFHIPILFLFKINIFTPLALLHQGPQHVSHASKWVKDPKKERKHTDIWEKDLEEGACEEMSHRSQKQEWRKYSGAWKEYQEYFSTH